MKYEIYNKTLLSDNFFHCAPKLPQSAALYSESARKREYMGGLKNYYHDQIIHEAEIWKISNIIGVPYELIETLEWEIEVDSSKDGLIYSYRVIFSDDSPKEILDQIPGLDENNTLNVAPWDFDKDYDVDEQFEAITEEKDLYKKYNDEIHSLKSLNGISVSSIQIRETLSRQIFIGIIGTLEAFLSEVFVNIVNDNHKYMVNFVESFPAFKKRQFSLSDIFKEQDKLHSTVKEEMLSVIYHNLPVVSNMYRDTFDIEFPNFKEVYQLVLKRHDLVHRNGKSKNGDVTIVDKPLIEKAFLETGLLAEQIAVKLKLEYSI